MANSSTRFNLILDFFSLEQLQHFQDLFADATGVASIITEPDGTPITRPSNFCRLCRDIIRETPKGRENCYQSDAILGRMSKTGAVIQPCLSAGLWDAGAGIYANDTIIAHWLIGQVRNDELDETRLKDYSSEIGADPDEFAKAWQEVPVMSLSQFQKISGLLFSMAGLLSQVANNQLKINEQQAEQKKAESVLKENEIFSKRIVDTANEGIWVMNAEDITTFVNKKMADMLDYTVQEMIGQPISMFMFEEDIPDHLMKTADRIKGETGLYERRVRKKDGSTIWTIVSSSPIMEEGKGYAGSFGMFQDITRRIDSEKELRREEERFRRMVEYSSDILVYLDENGVQQYISPSAEHITGFTVEELRRPFMEFIHPDDLEKVLSVFRELLEHPDRILKGSYRHRHKNGGYRHFETFGRNFFSDPTIRGVVANIRDVTEQKMAEEQLYALNTELDHRVRQRTSELESAIKELETFSYSISHDLKTPLRHINGFLGLFLETAQTGLSDEQMSYLNKISESAQEMSKLIDAILSFSRLNQAELRKVRINSTEMVHQVIKFFEPETKSRVIRFNVGQLHEITGDENLIRQVWTNLLSNAIKYTGKKEEALVEVGSFNEDGTTTCFVRDNGAGFNMKYAAKLFGVFQRFHKARDFDGVGIGLANVNRIIKRHGGNCRAEAEPDAGATFYFTLPD